jgi:L-iditol 2-dehydrogenase
MNMSEAMMRAAVLEKPLSIVVKTVQRPVPGPNDALIKVHCIGVCGSDIHYYEHGKIGRYVVDSPIILGHELAGEIIQVGDQVTNVAVGDRVAVEPGVTSAVAIFASQGGTTYVQRLFSWLHLLWTELGLNTLPFEVIFCSSCQRT